MSEELPEALLDAALERYYAAEPERRAAVIEELCAAAGARGSALRRSLEALEAAERTLARTFPERSDAVLEIAGLRVQRKLGSGAFGDVWLCEQREPVARPVAVKVLRPGAASRRTLPRFLAERQLLATLSHPTITPVYDAGCLPDGRPFFAMEFVDGAPITTFCNERSAPVSERLRLFLELCHGVAHAHARGIVHRDLKPGNVLVTSASGRPQPKIIDFGIAKALARDAATDGEAVTPPLTDAGGVLGTPGYMSPEQAEGRAGDVDARSDVFSLGVLLYELLCGERPWARCAAEHPTPSMPSEQLERQARDAHSAAQHELHRRAAAVRGDLDWITRKATAYRREDRYLDVEALVADLERHRAGRPVQAGPPTWSYRTRKLLRRHPLTSAAAALACAAIGVAAAVLWRSESRTADHFAAAAAALESLRQRASSIAQREGGPDEALRLELAEEALAFYERWLSERPRDVALQLARVESLLALSRVHWELGQGEAALRAAQQASEAADALLEAGERSLAVRASRANGARHRARALRLLRRWEDAQPWHADAVERLGECHRADPAAYGLELAAALREQGASEKELGRSASALALDRRSVAVLEQLVRDGHAVAEARADLGSAHLAVALSASALGDLELARAELGNAARHLDDLREERWRVNASIRVEEARLAARGADLADAAQRFELAAIACEEWTRREPREARAQALLQFCWTEAYGVHARRGDFERADRAMERSLALAEERVASALEPELPRRDLRRLAHELARSLWKRGRRRDLAVAERLVERAAALSAELRAPAAPQPWELEMLRLRIAAADARSEPAAWERLAEELAQVGTGASASAVSLGEAWIAIAEERLRRELPRDAELALASASRALETSGADSAANELHAELAFGRGRCALARGEVELAIASADELQRRLPQDAPSLARAGALRTAAARALRARGDAEGGRLEAARAAPLLSAVVDAFAPLVEQAPHDPWYVVTWALAEIDLAELGAAVGDREGARERLERALPRLEVVADEAHADPRIAERRAAGATLRRALE